MALEKTIKIKVDPGNSEKKIDSLDDKMEDLDKSERKASKSAALLKTSLVAAAVAAVSLGVKIANVTRRFQTFQASLKTATGSADKASIAFEAIRDFAASTPFELEQSVEAFTKLRNFGLDPSESALTSFGNTAVALGKDLNQMIEAVADAATGEFERLKEFGIKSKTQGDQVSFTFQGVTKTVGKNAEEITEFLKNIGDVNFAGAMEEQFNSLNGLISNFGDNIDSLAFNIGQAGLTDILTEGLNLANKAIMDLSDGFESGQIPEKIDAVANKFSGMAEDIVFSVNAVSNVFDKFFSDIPLDADKSTSMIIDAFASLPENIRAFVKILVVENLAVFDRISTEAEFLKESLIAIFTDDTIDQASARRLEAINVINDARDGSLSSIIKEREESISSFDAQIKKSDDLLDAFKKQRDERRKLSSESGGVLGQFKINAGGDDKKGNDGADNGKNFTNNEKFKTESLRAELNERLSIQKAFNESLLNETATFTEQELAIVEFERQQALAELKRRQEDVALGFEQQKENLKLQGEERAIILAELESQELIQKQIFESEKTRIEQESALQREDIARAEAEAKQAITLSAIDAAVFALTAGGKKATKAQRNLAVVNAGIKGYQSAVDAWQAGMSTGGPYAPVVAAAYTAASLTKTAGLIKKIRSTNGGDVSAGGGASAPPINSAIQTPVRQEVPNQRAIDFRGLSEVAAALRDRDPDEPLPVSFTQRIVAGLDQLEELSGQ